MGRPDFADLFLLIGALSFVGMRAPRGVLVFLAAALAAALLWDETQRFLIEEFARP